MNVSIVQLNEFEVVRSVFTLIFLIITLIVGIKIILNYFKHKKKEFITVGLALILISGGYFANAISFLTIIMFNYALDPPIYVFLLSIFMPLGLISWVYSMRELLFPNKYKKVTYGIYICSLAFIAFLIIAVIVDYTLIGERVPRTVFDYNRTILVLLFTFSAGGITAITGLLFARKSMKAEDPVIAWKGRFFLISILLIIIAAFLDGVFIGPYLLLKVLIRFLMTAGSIFYYFGFFLPEFIKRKIAE